MRKASLLLLFLIILPFSLPGQSFQVQVGDTIKIGNPGDEIALGGIIINITNQEIPVTLSRLTNDIPQGWSTSLCFENCAPPWIEMLEGTLAANDSLEFSIHFFTSQEPGDGQAKLEIAHPKVQSQIITFKASTMGNTGIKMAKSEMFDYHLPFNYPNPFNSQTKIKFIAPKASEKVRFMVFTIDGKSLYQTFYEIRHSGANEIIFNAENLPLSTLSSGIYFYQLVFFTENQLINSAVSKFVFIK